MHRAKIFRLGATAFAAAACLGALALGIHTTHAADSGAAPSARGTGTTAAQQGSQTSKGALRITGAYVPAPAAPDVATAYFTIANTSATADTLESVSCAQAAWVSIHRDVATGSGAEEMVPLAGGLTVPAHGTVALAPARGLHLMINKPLHQWRAGTHVRLVLHFAHAGSVPLTVPVEPMTATAGAASSMPPMPGM